MTRVLLTWARGLGAIVVIVVLAVVVPWLLVTTVGNPLPGAGWSWSQPVTNAALLGFLAALAWLFWAQMMVCLVIEVLAEARLAAGRSADWMTTVPGTFGGQQHLARALVQAVIAIGIGIATGPAIPTAHAAANPEPTTGGPQIPVSASSARTGPSPAQGEPHHGVSGTRTVEVATGDTLWALAERYLGSGENWRRIADLNHGRLMPDGERFTHASSIQPGWHLLVPDHTQHGKGAGTPRMVVQPGDTLWDVADREYGDGDQWPRIYDANQTRIEDPDLIFPGETLAIPSVGPSVDVSRPQAGHLPATPRDHASHQPQAVPHPTSASPAPERPTGEPARPAIPLTSSDRQLSASEAAGHSGGGQQAAAQAGHGDLAAALVGGGVLLGGSALAVFGAQRRRRFRVRGSGRTIKPTPAHLIPAEKTLRSVGAAGGQAAAFMNRALRELSYDLAQAGEKLPDVAAVRLTDDTLDLMLATPATDPRPEPWTSHDAGTRWSLSRTTTPADAVDAVAPYPSLVAVGADEHGATWLLDLEHVGILQLQGNPSARRDLARFMAVELALNQWSDHVEVTLAAFAPELVGVNPTRLRHQDQCDLTLLVNAVRRMHEASAAMGCDVLSGRLDGRGADTWMPHIMFTEQSLTSSAVDDLLVALAETPGRDAAALVALANDDDIPGAQVIDVDDAGQFVLAPWNISLTGNQLTTADAVLLASMIAPEEETSDESGDEPMPPATGNRPFEEISDTAGALRPELTGPRDGEAASESLLPLPDDSYLQAAATTRDDLAALAPTVPDSTRDRILNLDPTLDEDLAAWYDPDTGRPRLRVLGPVELRATGERTDEVNRRLAYFTELVAYLGTRENGVTPEQVAEAFAVQNNTIHSRIGAVRKWLGTNPETGDWYLPESTLSGAAKTRGVPVYEVDGLLIDADLLKRLRVRGEGRGTHGIDDLVEALRLVEGPPFDQLRSAGYGWLAATPLDKYLTAGIVDVAHIVATHALAASDPALARSVSQIAIAAAPFEDKPRLDLAAAMVADGNAADANTYLRNEVLNRSDDTAPPPPPSPRVTEVLNGRGKLRG